MTLEMSANSSSSFSARLQVVAPGFSWEKKSAFWMPGSSEKVRN